MKAKETELAIPPAKLIDKARDCYGSMQRSWWEFAKVVSQIKESEAYHTMGYESFKEFCEKEYTSLSYQVVHKLTMIVENWFDAIESRIAKDSAYQLPSYESCYAVGSIKEDVVPKEEISKLRKAILDNKITQQALRDRLKELIAKRRKSSDAVVEDFEKELSDELSEDEEMQRQMDEVDEIEEVLEEEEEEEEEADFEDIEEEESTGPLTGLRNRTAYLLDNLPALQASLKKGKISEETFEFADELQKLEKVISKFFDKLEELQ